MTTLRGEIVRFLLGGASTTLFSYAIYLLLLPWMPYLVAYGIAYVAGIAWSYTVSVHFVFRTRWTWRGLLQFPAVYLVQGAIGIVVVWLVVDLFELPAEIAPLVAIAASLPFTFLLSRRIVRPATTPARSDRD